MKRVFHLSFLVLFLFVGILTQAQAPEGFNYQAVARDNAGKLLTNESLTVKAIILSGASASNKVYEETHVVTTNAYGLFQLVVGQGSSSNTFGSIAWSTSPHHLKVDIDKGSGFVTMGIVQLQSVPYALHSKTAESAKTITNLDLSTADLNDVNSTGAATGNVLKWNGSSWVPGTDDNSSTSYTAGSGIDITGATISAKTGDALWNANKLSGRDLGGISPNTNQVLKWDGSKWNPGDDNGKTYFAGKGIIVSNDSIIALNNSAIWNADRLRNIGIASGSPTKNQVLQYDGSEWNFATISGGSGSSKSYWDSTANGIYYNNGGNVGINVDNPLSRLHVQDSLTSTATGIFYMVDNYLYGGPSAGARYTGQRSVVFGQGGGSNIGGMNVAGGDVASSGEAIGTYSLAAGDGAYNTGCFSFTGEDATSQSIAFFGDARATSTFNLGLYANADMSNSGSNYGIFAVADSGSTNYAGYFVGDVNYTGTLTNVSDARMKYDVNNLDNATSLIKQLQPRTYFYKQEGDAAYLKLSKGLQYGFIAQELEEVLPELVRNQVQMKGAKLEGSVDYKAVNYTALIPVLTQALKEQQEVIESLEKRISELENNKK